PWRRRAGAGPMPAGPRRRSGTRPAAAGRRTRRSRAHRRDPWRTPAHRRRGSGAIRDAGGTPRRPGPVKMAVMNEHLFPNDGRSRPRDLVHAAILHHLLTRHPTGVTPADLAASLLGRPATPAETRAVDAAV